MVASGGERQRPQQAAPTGHGTPWQAAEKTVKGSARPSLPRSCHGGRRPGRQRRMRSGDLAGVAAPRPGSPTSLPSSFAP